MKELFRKILFGEALIREYATVRIGEEIRERVYLRKNAGDAPRDVSRTHWVLCLDPLVFGIWTETTPDNVGDGISHWLYFRDGPCKPGEDPERQAVAVAELEFMDRIEEAGGCLLLFRLVSCRVHHIAAFKTRLLYSKYYRKPGLSFDKLKAFATAYSYPRKVRLVSFRGENYYNIFPMDLLGDIPRAGRFVFGLRHSNVALSRIIAEKKIVVSEVPSGSKEMIYQLGSHHSSVPPPVAELPFAVIPSPAFGFWVPAWAESCKEIRILRTMDLGSHMLMWGEPVGELLLNPVSDHLHHIHFLMYLHQLKKRSGYLPA
ncbi:MAG: hypothetical protein Q8927_07270 [Bacteroidota bacterium]|nr:hypothetical protein [Bacteroidota bacterium]MDP4215986.1 hypothetical protein [Bacteroidota bacterium]MDP4252539.1 hypothetical protein [Bacteroidota bacterium]MDP4257825.1 hypothetical protein [Bacteroidota bacterium]